MASTRKRTTKGGQIFYEIRVSRGRGKSYLTTRWYPPEGWGQKAIERTLAKEASEFERRCGKARSSVVRSKKKATSGRSGRPQRFRRCDSTAKQYLCQLRASQ